MADTRTRDTVISLLNYDVSDNDDDDDPFREIDTTLHEPTDIPPANGTKRKPPFGSDNKENGADALGIDAEVQITKKRKPVAKLDEARLLSQRGIPKLRALAHSNTIASKLRLKGKGHEYSDAAKLLGFYQLWLDDLYPRAKFADGLQMVEKVGHGKRMQIMRREWIDEGKPGYEKDGEERYASGDVGKEDGTEGLSNGETKQSDGKQLEAGSKSNTQDSIFGNLDQGEDDMFFADPKNATFGHDYDMNEPDDDELDALLAEQTATIDMQPHHRQPVFNKDEEDDLDPLLADQPARSPHRAEPKQQGQRSPSPSEDDLNALLAENEAVYTSQAEKKQPEASGLTAHEDEGEDELEALLAEEAVKDQ